MRRLVLLVVLLLISPEVGQGWVLLASTRQLTFEERVAAQEAIEQVYFSHLEGSTRTFDQAISRDHLERKVRTYLKLSAALDQFWKSPVTSQMLGAEADRISRSTKFPERLREIDAALGHDAFLIEETLVRAALVERLTRNFFLREERIHGPARTEAEMIRQQLIDGSLDPLAEHPRRTLVEAVASESPTASVLADPAVALLTAQRASHPLRLESTPEAIEQLRDAVPPMPGEPGPVVDEPGSFSIRVPLSSDAGTLRIASYVVPKLRWEDWWAANQGAYDETGVNAVAGSTSGSLGQAAQELASTCPQDDTWNNGTLGEIPDGRHRHAAVWTGTEMIVWGGAAETGGASANASRYDPLTDTWRPMSLLGSPLQVAEATAVWTGQEMIVWGPTGGGRYDPVSNTWAPLSNAGRPLNARGHSAVWTGSEMILWGGVLLPTGMTATGSRYNPATDSWQPTSEIGAPLARQRHTAVWTGNQMIVWGGEGNALFDFHGTGGRYDPATDTWAPLSNVNAPSPRSQHTAIWTGREMIVWGGLSSGTFGGPFVSATGGRYDPATDAWVATSLAGVSTQRRAHTAVWTGTRMIVWGGSNDPFRLPPPTIMRSGSLYDPVTDTWSPTSQLSAPLSVSFHTAVWTGSLMLLWGGVTGSGSAGQTLPFGGRYDPATDSWTPTASSPGGIVVSGFSPIVWTGTEMLAWSLGDGGFGAGVPGGGGRYDPMIDSWRAISTAGAPEARLNHAVVWTGDQMIVWGGVNVAGALSTGGLYDPLTDAWRPTSLADAPAPRYGVVPVWTGREMVVWGGDQNSLFSPPQFQTPTLRDGARYDPSTDTWLPLPSLGAPLDAAAYSVVWTGREMIVWGGYRRICGSFGQCPISLHSHQGARYDPAVDLWTPLPDLAPTEGRSAHSAIWTDREMIIVGGRRFPQLTPPKVGWVYDRAADTWSPLQVPPPSFPVDRLVHTAVWTGRHMLLWGGTSKEGVVYDHVTGSWRLMSTEGQPLQRGGHTAVWTGESMLLWGGFNGVTALPSGGRYSFGNSSDDDGDGLSECGGDCDDTDSLLFPGATELCDGRDNTCDGAVDEDASGLDTDADGTPNACDFCPGFSNPGQSGPDACIAAQQDGGQCLESHIVLPRPIAAGEVTLVRERSVPPDTIHFELNVSSCDRIDPVEILLNGQTIATFVEPQESCACEPPPYRVSASDASLLHDAWRTGGDNVFGIRKVGGPSPPGTFLGTFVGWVKARIGSGVTQPMETVCLFDFGGGSCSEPDQCLGGSTEDALSLSIPVAALLQVDGSLAGAGFADSTLPRTIDMSAVADGNLQLCVGPSGPARLYAADAAGRLWLVNPATGASSLAGALPFGLVDVAHEELSRRTFAQTDLPVGRALVEMDLSGPGFLDASSYLGLPFSGMEFVNRLLHGVEPTGPGARLMEVEPDSGFSRVVATLPEGVWDGLAYDPTTSLFYTTRAFDGRHEFWGIDSSTGERRMLHLLAIAPTALEFGPDDVLYATDGGALYRLDPTTGEATLIGSMGVSDIVSLATVRNLPRGCLDIVKQGEQTLAINGGCNAPPTAMAGTDRVAECTSLQGASVLLDGSSSFDPDSSSGTQDDIANYEWLENFGLASQVLLGTGVTTSVTLPLGVHQVTLKVTDHAGATDLDDIAVLVVDTTPPLLTVGVAPSTLWPPNHHMVPVSFDVAAADLCGAGSFALVAVTSSEPDDAPGGGDGVTTGDIQGAEIETASTSVELRAERDGAGPGRVYTVVYRATDPSGNATEEASFVVVPHDQGGVTEPVELSVRQSVIGTLVDWLAVPGAVFYNVIRGRVTDVREEPSEINLGAVDCIEAGSIDTNTAGSEDELVPQPGEIFFYLVEYNDGWASSYGVESVPKPRVLGSGGCHP